MSTAWNFEHLLLVVSGEDHVAFFLLTLVAFVSTRWFFKLLSFNSSSFVRTTWFLGLLTSVRTMWLFNSSSFRWNHVAFRTLNSSIFRLGIHDFFKL
jgi:hypothetical protein